MNDICSCAATTYKRTLRHVTLTFYHKHFLSCLSLSLSLSLLVIGRRLYTKRNCHTNCVRTRLELPERTCQITYVHIREAAKRTRRIR
jgi:hypothetical protein